MSCPKEITKIIHKKRGVKNNIDDTVLANISEAIQEIRYGSIQIHIQDNKVIQIDKVSKVRMR